MPEGSNESPRLPKRKRRTPDPFPSPAQIIAKCQEKHHCPMVAGQIIALITLINERQWTIAETANHSHVGRITISDILHAKTCPSTDTINALAETFGFDFILFNIFASICLRAEVSEYRH